MADPFSLHPKGERLLKNWLDGSNIPPEGRRIERISEWPGLRYTYQSVLLQLNVSVPGRTLGDTIQFFETRKAY